MKKNKKITIAVLVYIMMLSSCSSRQILYMTGSDLCGRGGLFGRPFSTTRKWAPSKPIWTAEDQKRADAKKAWAPSEPISKE